MADMGSFSSSHTGKLSTSFEKSFVHFSSPCDACNVILISVILLIIMYYLIRSELWQYYESRFGNLIEMPASDYQLITASNMKKMVSKRTQR